MTHYGKFDAAFCEFIFRQDKPFSVGWIAERLKCSESTARRLMDKFYHGHCAWKPDGHGNFTVLYFPMEWTREAVQAWLNARTKSGQSKATIRVIHGARRPTTLDTTPEDTTP